MISEESCNTEYWSNANESALATAETKYILNTS